MTVLHLVQLKNTPIFKQLQIEEALLRADERNWCILNEGTSPAIIMGISGKSEELIYKEKLVDTPIPIIRRFSGGGTVIVDHDTYFITFICNASCTTTKPFPDSIMRWTEKIYKPIFSPHPFCLHENDYVINNKKVGGNAQSICKDRWLHHSSLLWDYSSSHMNYLKMPVKTPLYRQQRPHTEFLCRIKDFWSEKNYFFERFVQELKCHFNVKDVKQEEIKTILHLPHRKATTYCQ